jgi:hypothetical protein
MIHVEVVKELNTDAWTDDMGVRAVLTLRVNTSYPGICLLQALIHRPLPPNHLWELSEMLCGQRLG